MSDFKNSRWQT